MPRISSINENNAFVKLQESANGRHCIGMLSKGEILLTNQGKRKRIILMDEMKRDELCGPFIHASAARYIADANSLLRESPYPPIPLNAIG